MSTRKRTMKPTPTGEQTPVKATDAEIARRVNTVYKMIVQGKSRAAILQHAAEKWSSSERMADEYMARARKLLADQSTRDRDEQLTMALERMTLVFDAALDAEDYQASIAAQREINKIIGLYAPTKQDVQVSGSMTWAQMLQQAQTEDTHDSIGRPDL